MKMLRIFVIGMILIAVSFLVSYYFGGYKNYSLIQKVNLKSDTVMILLSIIAVVVLLLDTTYHIRMEREFENIFLKIYDNPIRILEAFSILFILYVVCISVKLFLNRPSFIALLSIITTCGMLNMVFSFLISKNGFSISGITYRGDYYYWSDIQDCCWIDEGRIKVTGTSKKLFIKVKSTFILKVNPGQKNKIEDLLKSQNVNI